MSAVHTCLALVQERGSNLDTKSAQQSTQQAQSPEATHPVSARGWATW